MRIKFKKGCHPDHIIDYLRDMLKFPDAYIGSVNVYVQMYDKEMKPVKFNNDEYLIVEPGELSKQKYTEYVADFRRSAMKVV